MRVSILAGLRVEGVAFALGAAALFGASTPAAKMLLGDIGPFMLAGLLYGGAGLGLLLLAALAALRPHLREASVARRDLPWLLLVVLVGGVAAPVLLMLGLERVSAASASLLLNIEALATMAIAWLAFHEPIDRRILAGALGILAGAALLSLGGGAEQVGVRGIFIVGACLCWGIDNNITRKLSIANPVHITIIKGLAAGGVNLALARMLGEAWPRGYDLPASLLVGFFGYGVSLVCFTLALRHLGTARTSAYFSTAPFIGSLIAILLLHEPVTMVFITAAALMAAGVFVHLTESHEHEHTHEPLEHSHRHRHDAHHQHTHNGDEPPGGPHVHWHRHEKLTHRHAHMPDVHHRHRHED